jgi:hypothetical protein
VDFYFSHDIAPPKSKNYWFMSGLLNNTGTVADVEAAQRLSSGSAGAATQAAPGKASCEGCYPALTCNDLFDAM